MSQTQRGGETDGELYAVGDLLVDVGRQRVSRGGIEIVLPNLSFQLLLALIRAAPDVRSHDALMEQVWAGLVVSPETVTKRANLLREALGDDVREPRYVAGVRGRGYRLVPDVTRRERPPLTAIPQERPGNPARIGPSIPDGADRDPRQDTRPQDRPPRRTLFVIATLMLMIAGAVLVVKLRSSGDSPKATVQPAGSPAAGPRARTVAVLPFENISPGAGDAYLARGLPEMILNRLSRVTGLVVIARNSSFAAAARALDPREMGQQLNAAFLVSGTIQRRNDNLRITVQLVDATSGTLVWSENLDRALADIFVVQDEISNQVASAISARVGGVAPRAADGSKTKDLEAYLAYLRGRTLLGRLTVAESESAVPNFEKAIALDPDFAPAYASLYDARLQAADQRHEDLEPVRRRYRPLIDRALAIDPDAGAAYFARAMWGGESYPQREADFRRGADLDPSNGRGLTAYAEFLDFGDTVRIAEGAPILARALRVDPMSPRALFHAAMLSLDQDGAAAVEQNMQNILELDPDFVPALHQVALYRWIFHDRMAEAVQLLEHAIALDPNNFLTRYTAMAVYLDLDDAPAARAVANRMAQASRDPGLITLFSGNWRAAGRAAFDEANWIGDHPCFNWLIAEAVRDYALKTGELGRAVAFIRTKYNLQAGAAVEIEVCNHQPALVLSHLLAAQGQTQEARTLRQVTMAWNDANSSKFAGGTRRVRAEALMMEGRSDEALDLLAEDFRAGDHRQWWYTLRYDPVWMPLHGDVRFQALGVTAKRFVDSEHGEVEALRRRGVVPGPDRPDDPRGRRSRP